MTLRELLDLFMMLPPTTTVLNAPVNPHKHQGSAGGIALVHPAPTIWSQQPARTVGDVMQDLMRSSLDIGMDDKVYLVEGMHKAGSETAGLLLTPNGIRLVGN